MPRRLLAAAAVTLASGAVAAAAASQPPIVRSVEVVQRHVVLELTAGGTRPVGFAAAKRRAGASGVVRWQSPKALRPGTYFVLVKAVEAGGGGVTDCPPKQHECNVRWSNVRRVVVRRSS